MIKVKTIAQKDQGKVDPHSADHGPISSAETTKAPYAGQERGKPTARR